MKLAILVFAFCFFEDIHSNPFGELNDNISNSDELYDETNNDDYETNSEYSESSNDRYSELNSSLVEQLNNIISKSDELYDETISDDYETISEYAESSNDRYSEHNSEVAGILREFEEHLENIMEIIDLFIRDTDRKDSSKERKEIDLRVTRFFEEKSNGDMQSEENDRRELKYNNFKNCIKRSKRKIAELIAGIGDSIIDPSFLSQIISTEDNEHLSNMVHEILAARYEILPKLVDETENLDQCYTDFQEA